MVVYRGKNDEKCVAAQTLKDPSVDAYCVTVTCMCVGTRLAIEAVHTDTLVRDELKY